MKEIIESIKPLLKTYGFYKNKLNWIFEDENIVKILNIQKSSFGKQIYLNIGIIIKSLEPEVFPVINKCHIQIRLDNLIKGDILDFENNIKIEDRATFIKNLLSSNPYNFFTLNGTLNNIRNFIKESKTEIIFLKAKEYLGIDNI
ncbi:DUF4304 domain-containing protein [Leptospira sp. GIMC2001]|uniref:DUF4304 domain-containing protein n=1 Tax=Leptospira sp. GIMC2001 TaxID=1513297 RepID=UPI00234936E4|nr:DUF4304 domain-containing protein [Leptospira sp. GIMC2001]WCL50636.1 DUF4304 domain-containing protein [Leptospira sp. GIMC2001]